MASSPEDGREEGPWLFPDLSGIDRDVQKGTWWPYVIFSGLPAPDPFPAQPAPGNLDPQALARREGMSRGQKAAERAWLERLRAGQKVIRAEVRQEDRVLMIHDALAMSLAETQGRKALEAGVKVQDQDPVAARAWFEEGALFGNVPSQFHFSAMCDEGLGGPVDQVCARRWYLEASKHGHLASMNNLAWMYAYGEGGAVDLAEAIQWMSKAAEAGYARAQSNLASWYYHGELVPQDLVASRTWHGKAAEQGFAASQEEYGAMLYYGVGGPEDEAEAVIWCRKAAEGGRADACFAMFQFCLYGIGTAQDRDLAEAWMRKALAGRSPKAQAWLNKSE